MPITNAILNSKGKVSHYICSKCGCKYKMRFQDSELCFACLKDIQHEIDLKLSKSRENEGISNVLYAKNWVNKKRKK